MMKPGTALLLIAVFGLTGCNQYSTPAIESSTSARNGAPVESVADTQPAAPLNNGSDPSQTTGSVGGSPSGTSSVQTVPSSSNGVR